MNSQNVNGKVVIVTGSSRGIGRETARQFGSRGARIVVNGRDSARLEATAAELGAAGCEVLAVSGDMTTADDARGLVEAAVARFGRVDVLINNAGISMRGRFESTTPAVVAGIVRSNVEGAIYPSIAALPHIRAAGGSIVFVSSLAAVRGFPGVAVYSAAKMAVTGLAEAMDAELSGSGVHVGIVYLGFVENDLEKRIFASDGSLIPSVRPAELTQRDAAAAIVRCVDRRRFQYYLTARGKVLVVLNRLLPGVARAIVAGSRGSVHRLDDQGSSPLESSRGR